MNLALLFWFYKDLDVCENRLAALRACNLNRPIYGLYGGDPAEAAHVQARLGCWLNDFYVFTENQDSHWKWQHGDQLIAAWHRDRGHALAWDTIVIVQWDMLLLAPVERLFPTLKPGEALFSGLRTEHEVADWWGWLNGADPEKRADRDAFRLYLETEHGYRDALLCCLFIVVCLPRRFLDLYNAAGPPLTGFLEYKLPTLARVFGIPFCVEHPYRPWWASNPVTRQAPEQERLLNAVGQDISLNAVLAETARKDGLRIMHPYRQRFPRALGNRWMAWVVLQARRRLRR